MNDDPNALLSAHAVPQAHLLPAVVLCYFLSVDLFAHDAVVL